ncbi:hypothetical protein [Enterococcus devriesei]|uniref:hypothetical protein n=1 Tax=Enterococcus devriesei TaxID=319970 RepID=UPI0028E4AB98|nr:hypothetical protein [Enterococcus devriesei]
MLKNKYISTQTYYLLCIIWAAIFTLISYRVVNLNGFDYEFHLSRIVGLAQSIQNFDFLPNLNFIFSHGTGYASPMFYGNWQLYIPAITYIITKNAIIAFTYYGFFINSLTVIACFFVYKDISQEEDTSFMLACITPVFFSLYGFGMTAVVPLAFLLLHSLYLIVIKDKKNAFYLGIVTSLLIQSHTLSTLVLAIYSMIFILVNMSKLSIKKIVTLFKALIISLLLSIGFIIQFLEQISSQSFFFQWNFRNFPRSSSNMFQSTNILKTVTEQVNYGGFASLVTPLTSLLLFTFIIFLLKKNLTELNPFSKSLIAVSLITILLTSNLLPWKRLQDSFLGTLQYPYRLTFFLPVLILIVYLISLSKQKLMYFCLLSLVFYFTSSILTVPKDITIDDYNKTNERYRSAFDDNTKVFISPIGDEYYSIDVDNQKVRETSFNSFEKKKNIVIHNMKNNYNKLEFDFSIKNPKLKSSVILPRVWYKGYTAVYSQGGEGSQPDFEKKQFTNKEVSMNLANKRNFSQNKVLNSGKIKLNLTNSGHVSISYKKTFLQYIGFILEIAAWIFFSVVFLKKYFING